MKKSGNSSDNTNKGEVIEGELVSKDSKTADDKTSDSASQTDKASSQQTADSVTEQPGSDKQPSNWSGKLALVLAVAAIGGVGYLYWLQMQSSNQQTQAQQQTQSSVESTLNGYKQELSQQISGMNQQISGLEQKATQDQANIDELQKRLTLSIQQVTAEQKNTRKDWLLAEVEYLLRLANQRVLMEQTPQGALKLLRSADKILRETDDVTIYDIRKAVATDIAALEAVPMLDTEGLFLRLGALNAQVDQLQVIPLTEQHKLPELMDEVTSEEFTSTLSQNVKEAWAKVADKFNQLVVVQHRDEPVEPLLSPQQSYYLQQNLHLMLEQAQLSLLQRKQGSYIASLKKAQKWVGTYFEQNHSNTQALLKALQELEQVQVAPEMPDISGSLTTLKDYLQQMRKLKEEAA